MPGMRVTRGFGEDDGEGLRGDLARNLRLTFQEPFWPSLPCRSQLKEISRGVMGAGGQRRHGLAETQCVCACWLSTWLCVSGPSPCPESQHGGTWWLSARDSDPPLPKGASLGWTPIQMWSGSLLPHGIMMPWGFFSLTFLFQHRSKEERHSLTVATPRLKQEGGAIPSRKSLPPPSP